MTTSTPTDLSVVPIGGAVTSLSSALPITSFAARPAGAGSASGNVPSGAKKHEQKPGVSAALARRAAG